MFIGKKFTRAVVEIIRRGGIGVLPTDTIYGISGSALQPAAVKRAAALRGRAEGGKRFIVLIADASDLRIFGIRPDERVKKFLHRHWPGPLSVEFPVGNKWRYLHMGHGSFALRVPAVPRLRALLRKTGPLISTSVNPPGDPPADTIAAARRYFDSLDFYVDAGRLHGAPSTLVAYEKGEWRVLREGALKLDIKNAKLKT